jgi:Zn-dependent metalloprotease
MPPVSEAAAGAFAQLKSSAPEIVGYASERTRAYSVLRAPAGQTIVGDDTAATPEARALAFLTNHGAVVGINDQERQALSEGAVPVAGSELRIVDAKTDEFGFSHVRMDQYYQGLRVFGAQLAVHMNGAGITAVNGDYVPDIAVKTVPVLSKTAASEVALAVARKKAEGAELTVAKVDISIYAHGLLEGTPVVNHLAYSVDVAGAKIAEQIWVDAMTGAVLNQVPLDRSALHRIIYSPQYDPMNPNLFIQREEGQPPSPLPFVNNLYEFAGQTYNFYASAFGRDSYDGAGHTMNSVYLLNQQCPNAYWNGTSTNYCPIFDADDVVSHEWSHAYTEYTHGLIYAYQSGALNESYSDIFGESVDLLNNSDGQGGSNNAKPYPDGQRWLVGEDLGAEVQELLLATCTIQIDSAIRARSPRRTTPAAMMTAGAGPYA